MKVRRPKVEFFIGSTVDEIKLQYNDFFKDTCPGNIPPEAKKLYK